MLLAMGDEIADRTGSSSPQRSRQAGAEVVDGVKSVASNGGRWNVLAASVADLQFTLAVTGRGLSPACQRRPHLKHAYLRIETPHCMSMDLSAPRVSSHFQHRIGILVPSTSATWRLSLTDD